jgi:hypothetical protein
MGQFVASMRREMDVPEQVEAYLASQPGPKQADLRRLHAHIEGYSRERLFKD